MHIVVVGVDFKTASVERREKLSFHPDGIAGALTLLLSSASADRISEAVILSTCNRVEIYAAAPDRSAAGQIKQFMAQFHGISTDSFEDSLYTLYDDDAIRHMFLVASSTKSMIPGETQIQSQIKQAFETALSGGAVGPLLTGLFQNALRVGKRVRTETKIGEHSLSVSHAAVAFIQQEIKSLRDKHIAIVGIGKMSVLTIRTLQKLGARNITVINRTKERVSFLLDDSSVEACGFDEFATILQQADVVISSTAATEPILTTETMCSVLPLRDGKPLLVLDIAVPRDVEPAVGALDGVTLCNIDQLQGDIDCNKEKRCAELAKVNAIVSEELTIFGQWQQSRHVKPIILDLKERVETIRTQELQRALRRMETDLPEGDSEIVHELTRRIVNKILHKPIVRLREQAGLGNGDEFAGQVRELFDLET